MSWPFVTIDHSLPGSSVHGISQVRTLEWVAISFSRGSRTRVSRIAGRLFTVWATREALLSSFCVLVVGITQNQVFLSYVNLLQGLSHINFIKTVGRMEVTLLQLFIREQNSEKKIFKNKRTSLVIQWLRQHSQCMVPGFNTWLGN